MVEDNLPMAFRHSELGNINTNCKTQIMNLRWVSKLSYLQRNLPWSAPKIFLKAMLRIILKEGGGYLLEMTLLEFRTNDAIEPPPKTQKAFATPIPRCVPPSSGT